MKWIKTLKLYSKGQIYKQFAPAKTILSAFTKDAQCRISAENVWTVIAPDLIELTWIELTHLTLLTLFLNEGVSLSDAKFMGGEY